MRISVILATMGTVWALPAHASEPQVEGAIYLERHESGERRIEPATELRSGDKVVLLVRWRVAGDRDGFTVTTPVPRTLAFQRESSEEVEVSTDGGRSWTRFGQLRSPQLDRVTHLRWKIDARQAAEGSGSFAYSALVR